MSFYNVIRFIVNLIILLMVIVAFIWFYLETKKEKLNKRLKKYSISKVNDDKSLFDMIRNIFIKWRNNFNKLLKKSPTLVKYSKGYSKFIDKNKSNMEEMDFVSTKFILGILVVIILIVSYVVQYNTITFFEMIIAFILGFFSLDVFLISRRKFVKKRMENDLLKAITIMNNSFKSGRSIIETIEIVYKEIDGPLKEEFERMYHDLNYGLDLETVFERFENRVKLKEVGYITTSLMILNKTGGNIVSVFSSIEKTVFNNKKLQDELNNLTKASKALYHILTVIPFILGIVIYFLDPTYFNPLISNPLGIIVILLIVAMYLVYIFVVSKIIRLKEY